MSNKQAEKYDGSNSSIILSLCSLGLLLFLSSIIEILLLSTRPLPYQLHPFVVSPLKKLIVLMNANFFKSGC